MIQLRALVDFHLSCFAHQRQHVRCSLHCLNEHHPSSRNFQKHCSMKLSTEIAKIILHLLVEQVYVL